MLLPNANVNSYGKAYQTLFAGLDRRRGAPDGSVYDMRNMSGDASPVASPRKPRYLVHTLSAPQGLVAANGIGYVDNGIFYYNGVSKITGLTAGEKTLVVMGVLILIFPDAKYYDTQSDTSGNMEYEKELAAGTVTFRNGTYMEEAAERNTIAVSGSLSIFSGLKAGDAVTISGATHAEDNGTFIIREIDEENGVPVLRFYPETFSVDDGESYTDPAAITISRKLPEGLSFPFVHENRLWACWRDTLSGHDIIGASALGDPFNFFAFDSGVESGSYFSEVLTPGDWTGACSFIGYPCFFKQDYIYKVYGTLPSDYSILSSARMGVDAGADKSLAIAGERLYYLSIAGIVQYAGSFPYPVGQAFADARFRDAVAGSDGLKYYVSMRDEEDHWALYVYDTQVGSWHIHDDLHVIQFAWFDGGLYALCTDGKLWFIGSSVFAPISSAKESPFAWYMQTGEMVEQSPNRKRVQRVEIRVELFDGSNVDVSIKFDDEEFQPVKTIDSPGMYSVLCPVVPRRCDHYAVRLDGFGDAYIHALTRYVEVGSERH